MTLDCPAQVSLERPIHQANLSTGIDLMFRAFSDRTRLRILSLLRKREFCVGDIVEILQVPQPRISRHLAYLRKAALVTVRKAGIWSYYSLAPAQAAFHRKLLSCLGNCFSEVPQIQADQVRAAEIKKSGGCCPSSKPTLGVGTGPVAD
jgi:ArsR family transcriptional regulator, arsenate/arsenite/antimonite-responsive transcriptional repressor